MIGVDWFVKKIESKYDIATFLNRHLQNNFVVDKKMFPSVQSRTGELYHIHPNICTVGEVYSQYKFDDILPNETVIDIGANVGAFSLMASRKLWPEYGIVYAYEPILYNELCANIKLNINRMRGEIKASDWGLGYNDDGMYLAEWENELYLILTKTLRDMINGTPYKRCDFLKCDCEGAEWGIQIDELKDIRRIEIEFHFGTHHQPRLELIKEIEECFDITINKTKDTWWVHGTNRNR